MLIIQREAQGEPGFHPFQSQSHRTECWLEGYVEVPTHLADKVMASGGWCDLTLEDGILMEVTPTAPPEQESLPDPEADRDEMLIDLEYRLTLLELGVD